MITSFYPAVHLGCWLELDDMSKNTEEYERISCIFNQDEETACWIGDGNVSAQHSASWYLHAGQSMTRISHQFQERYGRYDGSWKTMKAESNLMEQLHTTAGGIWKQVKESTETKALRKSFTCVPRTLLGQTQPQHEQLLEEQWWWNQQNKNRTNDMSTRSRRENDVMMAFDIIIMWNEAMKKFPSL